MKRFKIAATIMAIGILLPNIASAQETVPSTQHGVGKLDEKTEGTNVRASQLIGMNIQNDQGQSVGEINDLVIDGNTGRVRYAAVTYGGFLGVGDKLFAVPFQAFKVRQNPDDPSDRGDNVMVLNVTPAQLKGAVGFDQEHWPNMADQTFIRDLDKRYGVEHTRDRNGVELKINRSGVDIKTNK